MSEALDNARLDFTFVQQVAAQIPWLDNCANRNKHLLMSLVIMLWLGYSATLCNADSNMMGDDKEIALIEVIVKMYDSGAYDNDPEAKRKALKVKQNYESMQSAAAKLEKSRFEAEVYKEAQRLRELGANQDMYHEVEKRIQKEYGLSQYDAHQMIENNDPKVAMLWDIMVQEYNSKLLVQARINITNKYKIQTQVSDAK